MLAKIGMYWILHEQVEQWRHLVCVIPEHFWRTRTIQDSDWIYNYPNEQHRFGWSGQALKGQRQLLTLSIGQVMTMMVVLELDFTLTPTFQIIYESPIADLMRHAQRQWHQVLTQLPCAMESFYQAKPTVAWFVLVWLDYGRGDSMERELPSLDDPLSMNTKAPWRKEILRFSDSGFISIALFGFCIISGNWIIARAGFIPLETRNQEAATYYGSEILGMEN